MVAAKEFSWEEVSSPDFGSRAAWRQAVAEIADKARTKLPECAGRVDSAVKIVLVGDVELLPDGTAKVASQSNGTTAYHVVNGRCDCRDYERAPGQLCKHRLAFGLARRAQELTNAKLADANNHAEAAQPQTTPTPLPEAPASVNVHLDFAGRQVQLTLRDSDEGRLLARLETILQRYPVVTTAADTTPQCPQHGAMKRSTKGKGFYCPHKLPDGTWCKGK
jgi:hypothetical protein